MGGLRLFGLEPRLARFAALGLLLERGDGLLLTYEVVPVAAD
jgi:hypothetical protein